MTTSDIQPHLVAALGKSDLFAGLAERDLAALAALMRAETFSSGQMLFSRGQAGDGLYLVTSGRVRLSVTTGEGRELTFRFAEAGDIMGEIAAIDRGPRSADAVAVGEVRAYALAADQLRSLMDEHPAIARAALGFVCRRLRETSDQLEEIALYPIERRVARFVLSALDLGGHEHPAGDVTLNLRMSQTELALLLGASRPKVNVALGALTQAGAITRKGDAIVCHVAALRAYAEGLDKAD